MNNFKKKRLKILYKYTILPLKYCKIIIDYDDNYDINRKKKKKFELIIKTYHDNNLILNKFLFQTYKYNNLRKKLSSEYINNLIFFKKYEIKMANIFLRKIKKKTYNDFNLSNNIINLIKDFLLYLNKSKILYQNAKILKNMKYFSIDDIICYYNSNDFYDFKERFSLLNIKLTKFYCNIKIKKEISYITLLCILSENNNNNIEYIYDNACKISILYNNNNNNNSELINQDEIYDNLN